MEINFSREAVETVQAFHSHQSLIWQTLEQVQVITLVDPLLDTLETSKPTGNSVALQKRGQ